MRVIFYDKLYPVSKSFLYGLTVWFLLAGFFEVSFGQDSQYWTNQYGTYGELLGGTIIGSASDLSATFYNPGALAFSKDSALVLTTGSYQFIYIDFNNVTGSNLNLSSWYTNTSAGLFAMRLPLHFVEGDQIAISGLARQDFEFNAEDIYLSDYPREDFESSRVSINHDITEYWYGLSWSKQISKKIGVGFSLYIPYRAQTEKWETIYQAYDTVSHTSDLLSISSVD